MHVMLQAGAAGGGAPLLPPPGAGLGANPARLLPPPPLPGQGSHGAGAGADHPSDHALPQGDLGSPAQGSSLHHKLSPLEWRNVLDVHCRFPSPMEAGYYTRHIYP